MLSTQKCLNNSANTLRASSVYLPCPVDLSCTFSDLSTTLGCTSNTFNTGWCVRYILSCTLLLLCSSSCLLFRVARCALPRIKSFTLAMFTSTCASYSDHSDTLLYRKTDICRYSPQSRSQRSPNRQPLIPPYITNWDFPVSLSVYATPVCDSLGGGDVPYVWGNSHAVELLPRNSNVYRSFKYLKHLLTL